MDCHGEDLSSDNDSVADSGCLAPNSASDDSEEIPLYQIICNHLKQCNVKAVEPAIADASSRDGEPSSRKIARFHSK